MSEFSEGLQQPSKHHTEIKLREDKLVDEEEGFRMILSKIKNGDIVLMGDLHGKRKTHELFHRYMERLNAGGVEYSVALELPYQLTEEIGNKAPEEIIRRTSEIYTMAGKNFNPRFGEDILPILQFSKDKGIKVFCISDGKGAYHANPSNNYNHSNIKDNDEWMALQLQKAREGRANALLVNGRKESCSSIGYSKIS